MTAKCNAENMLKVVEAAESGKYRQAFTSLRVLTADGEFCYCFGGLADEIAIQNGVAAEWAGALVYDTDSPRPGQAGYPLTPNVRAWLGLEEFVPFGVTPFESVVDANDGARQPFATIARRVRKHYGLPARNA